MYPLPISVGVVLCSRCLEAEVTPYVVTKKTVFKWQDAFWQVLTIVKNTLFNTFSFAFDVYVCADLEGCV